MKTFFHLITFIFFPFILTNTLANFPNHAAFGRIANKEAGKGTLLVYTGNFTSPRFTYDIGIHVEMDPAIGLRYEVVYEKGNSVLSHIAIFHEFSNPNQSVLYNFLSHKSDVTYNSGSSGDNSPDLKVMGSETVDKYTCTHLENLLSDNGHTSKDDFWMCKDFPGFQALTKILNQLSSGAGAFAYNGIIFQWGGLVKMTHYFEDKKTGVSQSAEINLDEAEAMNFPNTDFDVPSK